MMQIVSNASQPQGSSGAASDDVRRRLVDLATQVRRAVIGARDKGTLAGVAKTTQADTIYAIDAEIDPVVEAWAEAFADETGQSLLLVAEGVEGDYGEGVATFPHGTDPKACDWVVITDPIDGTRGLMYDKRAAWFLAGAGRNTWKTHGRPPRLRDLEAAVMAELPTSKMGLADVLHAVGGGPVVCERIDLRDDSATTFTPQASGAGTIDHGFVSVSNFFPGTKVLAGELSEAIVRSQIGPADVTRATVFEDQYISTGGQWYELIVGHDRFNADLRPAFYARQGQPEGLCCHPYDCCALLIAEAAGVIITDETGRPLDGPLDVITGLNWVGYANADLRRRVEPAVRDFLAQVR